MPRCYVTAGVAIIALLVTSCSGNDTSADSATTSVESSSTDDDTPDATTTVLPADPGYMVIDDEPPFRTVTSPDPEGLGPTQFRLLPSANPEGYRWAMTFDFERVPQQLVLLDAYADVHDSVPLKPPPDDDLAEPEWEYDADEYHHDAFYSEHYGVIVVKWLVTDGVEDPVYQVFDETDGGLSDVMDAAEFAEVYPYYGPDGGGPEGVERGLLTNLRTGPLRFSTFFAWDFDGGTSPTEPIYVNPGTMASVAQTDGGQESQLGIAEIDDYGEPQAEFLSQLCPSGGHVQAPLGSPDGVWVATSDAVYRLPSETTYCVAGITDEDGERVIHAVDNDGNIYLTTGDTDYRYNVGTASGSEIAGLHDPGLSMTVGDEAVWFGELVAPRQDWDETMGATG